ncbi:MAG TPA: ABC transporter permease subunit, partial [Phycisphaerae bacterium]
MLLPRRVRTVFVKELIDIMRDRRTLVALLVVPIVLYPLLMLGAIQALSLQTQQIAAEKLVVGVLSKPQQLWLGALAHEAADIYVRRNPPGRASSAPADQTEWANVELEAHEARGDDLSTMLHEAEVGIVRDLKRAIENRQIQIGIELSEENEDDPATRQLHARLTYDPEEVRSAAAFRRFTSVFGLLRDEKLTHRMLVAGIPLEALRPIVLESQRITTPGSLLGQILPLILVLMTITGAIYPAIDLTAGERERGTLETLMVCPVPPFELIVGKFMVVTTVALIGAALNLASVSATVFFGGFERIVTGGGAGG